jgi:hypothetical protein
MAADELLLLHSPEFQGTGKREAGEVVRCVRWRNVYSPATGGTVRRCAEMARRRSSGLLGEIGDVALGDPGPLRGTLSDVKGVLLTGAVAAGGAILTDRVFSMIASKWNVTGWKRYMAEAATGIALGIAIGRFLKRPRLAATVAIGPVVVAGLRMLGDLMGTGPFAGLSGYDLGMMSIEPYREALAGTQRARPMGAMQVGPGVPAWMFTPEGASVAGDSAAY